jgi:endoglucanase
VTRRLTLPVVVVATVVVATVLALVATGRIPFSGGQDQPGSTRLPAAAEVILPATFLSTYVADDGRVVRHGQGEDTVSEGQAYGMLISVGTDRRDSFGRIWSWTRTHLMRPDGLISWRWSEDKVADPSSAADADLDAARALVLAGKRFDEPSYTAAGRKLGAAILDHETVRTPAGLVLVAGSWATGQAPYAFNPSYVSPAATSVLGAATADPRWKQLEAGSRTAVAALTPAGHLPPDWAQVSDNGSVQPVSGPGGQPVQFGYDAARMLVRYAESCTRSDRELAGTTAALLGDGSSAAAVYDLGGSPQTSDRSPLTLLAKAAGLSATNQDRSALDAISAAETAAKDTPTYYGDAWAVLGPMLLSDPDLGGCPPLEEAS